MGKLQRGTRVWLVVMGVIIGIAAIAEVAAAPLLSVVLVGGYAALLTALFAENRVRELQKVIPRAIPNLTANLAAASRSTSAAREAVARARRLSNSSIPEVVSDIGLIVNTRDRNGKLRPKNLSQTGSDAISLGEVGVQPFVKLLVPPDRSHRTTLVRFEVIDRTGQVQFSREVQQYVQDGENLIPCDRQLPLQGNDRLGRAGAWELQVTVNGTLAAVHSFNTMPDQSGIPDSGSSARRARLSADGELPRASPPRATPAAAAPPPPPEEEDDDRPLSLDELLREQRGGKS